MCRVCDRNQSKLVIKRDCVLALVVPTAERQEPNSQKIKCSITNMVISEKDMLGEKIMRICTLSKN